MVRSALGSSGRHGRHMRGLGDVDASRYPGDVPLHVARDGRRSLVGGLDGIRPLRAGAVLYTLITGRPPFRGRDAEETLSLVVEGDLEAPRRVNPKVDRELEAVCLKCLDRDPGRRYGSANRAGQRPAPLARSRADPVGRAAERHATSAILGPSAPAATRLPRGRGAGAVDRGTGRLGGRAARRIGGKPGGWPAR